MSNIKKSGDEMKRIKEKAIKWGKRILTPIESWKAMEELKKQIKEARGESEENKKKLLKRAKAEQKSLFTDKVESFLQQNYFILSEEDIQEIKDGTFKYPDYNSEELKKLLEKISTTTGRILKGKFEDESWEFTFTVGFYTSPKQLKLIWQDRIRDYPALYLDNYNIQLKVNFEGRISTGIAASRRITLGQCVSLLQHCECEWLV